MVIDDLYTFDELSKSLGSRYLAVTFIAKQSRRLAETNKDYKILESKLIQWVITGNCPYTESQLNSRKIVSNNSEIDELLCWVNDKDVVDEVRRLYKLSVQNRTLIMCENSSLSIGKTNRVNILLRMAWYSSCT